MKEQQVKYEKANSEHSNRITFTNKKHPKEGPRAYQKGDKQKSDEGYERIDWSKK